MLISAYRLNALSGCGIFEQGAGPRCRGYGMRQSVMIALAGATILVGGSAIILEKVHFAQEDSYEAETYAQEDHGIKPAGDNQLENLIKHKIVVIGEVLKKLPDGKIVIDAPKRMKVDDTRTVYANVGVNVPFEHLRKHLRPEDQSLEGALKVSNEMYATLTGEAFGIARNSPETQGVAEGFPTIWSWNVKAEKEGEQQLEATLYAIIPDASGGKTTIQYIDSYRQTIGISVKKQSWTDWLKSSKEALDNVKALVLTVGGAVTVVLGWLGWSFTRAKASRKRVTSARRRRPSGQDDRRRTRQA
jgi:hypothetical protein